MSKTPTTRSYGKHFTVNDRGHLQVEKCDLVEIAKTYGTPLFIYSENTIRENYQRIKKAFEAEYPDIVIHFACKTNDILAFIKVLQREGSGLDVNGPGELHKGLLAGISPEKIVFNGNNKQTEELRVAVETGIGINVDSVDELELLNEVSISMHKRANVNLRIAIAPEEWSRFYLADYKRDLRSHRLVGKFGIDYREIVEVSKKAKEMEGIRLQGLHNHMKSQNEDTDMFKSQIDEMVNLMVLVKDKTGIEFEYLDLGGGYPIARNEGYGPKKVTAVPSIEEYAKTMGRTLIKKLKERGLRLPKLGLEPGRYISGNTGILLTEVGNIKKILSGKTMVSLDASTMNLLWILTTKWYYHPVVVNKADAECTETVKLAGPLCWGIDWFASDDYTGYDVVLPPVKRGDLICFLDAGAYAQNMSNSFNGFPRPGGVLVNGDQCDVIRVPETVNDLTCMDRVPPRLLV